MPFFDIFASPRWSPLRMRTKVASFFIFFQELSNKKKIKALRPKMTKIASRGGGSCLNAASDIWTETFLSIVTKHVSYKKLKHLKPKLPCLGSIPAPTKQSYSTTSKSRKTVHDYSFSLLSQFNLRHPLLVLCKINEGKTTYRSIPDLITDTGTTLQDDVDKANACNVFCLKEIIVTRIPQACQRIHMSSPPFKHHHQKSMTYCSLCQRRKHLDGMASQPTCYVCVPMVMQRVYPPFLTGHSQMVFFLRHGNWLLSFRFLKKGCMARPNNHRPIALLSVVGKVCEEIVYKKLYHFVSPILSDNQSGFRRKDGAAHQLILVWSMNGHTPWTKISMSEPCSLTWKWRSIKCGTRDYLSSLSLLESTIVLYCGSGITCLTVINASKSTIPHQRQSGFMLAYIPLGAILSPLLFIIHMNDITSLSVQDQASFTNLFADDTSLYVANGDLGRVSNRTPTSSWHKWQHPHQD